MLEKMNLEERISKIGEEYFRENGPYLVDLSNYIKNRGLENLKKMLQMSLLYIEKNINGYLIDP